ncbi:hypothetical protein [Streptomyces fulvoviolaceus]|uniref:hypothetical protein n=1 Tax=Streptomyces fulvoviolaceus TaxID=285535 RepID=UPI0004CA1537|nr:hypothetical protein [Streptomyces fulvoviolaceus]MCT9084543.1 hypothetical protein [Streptomyces fulvoviolaceus]
MTDDVFPEDSEDDAFSEDALGDGESGAEFDPAAEVDAVFEDGLLAELRQAAGILDPVPAELTRIAVEAFALHDLDARLAELTFDSLVDAIPVRGATDAPRMLTFHSGDVTIDVEVSTQGLMGQVLPPQPASIEVLTGPQSGASLVADDMGRFTSGVTPTGPFALRLRTGGDVVVTEWLRA